MRDTLTESSLEEDFDICDTCKSKIDISFYRIIVLRDKTKNPLILRFHYFFPCWDIDHLAEKYHDYEIMDAGISFDLNHTMKNQNFRNFKENEDLWT